MFAPGGAPFPQAGGRSLDITEMIGNLRSGEKTRVL